MSNLYYAISVGTTATQVAFPATGPVAFFNNGAAPVYLGTDATVTTATGFPVLSQTYVSLSATTMQFGVYAVAGTATQDLRVLIGAM